MRMIKLHNKIHIKLISIILIQIFLVTGLAWPGSSSNKDISSLYIYYKDLRVPMMNRAGSSDGQRMRQTLNKAIFNERGSISFGGKKRFVSSSPRPNVRVIENLRQKQEIKKGKRKYIRLLMITGLSLAGSYIGYHYFDPSKETLEALKDLRNPPIPYVLKDSKKQHKEMLKYIKRLQSNKENTLDPGESALIDKFLEGKMRKIIEDAGEAFGLEPELVAAFLYEEEIYKSAQNQLKAAIEKIIDERIMQQMGYPSTLGSGQVSQKYMFDEKFLDILLNNENYFFKTIESDEDLKSFREFVDSYGSWWRSHGAYITKKGNLLTAVAEIKEVNPSLLAFTMRAMADEISERNKDVKDMMPDMGVMKKERSKEWLVEEYKKIPKGTTNYGDLSKRFSLPFGGIEFYHALTRYYALARIYSGATEEKELSYKRPIAKVNAYEMFLKRGVFKNAGPSFQYNTPKKILASHSSLLSKNNSFTREGSEPVTDKFGIAGDVFDVVKDPGRIIKTIPVLGTMTTGNLDTMVTFTIRGSGEKKRLSKFLIKNPHILRRAIERSTLLQEGDLKKNITIILADKYDYLGGDHLPNHFVILNASDSEDMFELAKFNEEKGVFVSELLTSILSEELSHERGAKGDPDTEETLAKKCAYYTTLFINRKSLAGYVNFIGQYRENRNDYKDYFEYLKKEMKLAEEHPSLPQDISFQEIRDEAITKFIIEETIEKLVGIDRSLPMLIILTGKNLRQLEDVTRTVDPKDDYNKSYNLKNFGLGLSQDIVVVKGDELEAFFNMIRGSEGLDTEKLEFPYNVLNDMSSRWYGDHRDFMYEYFFRLYIQKLFIQMGNINSLDRIMVYYNVDPQLDLNHVFNSGFPIPIALIVLTKKEDKEVSLERYLCYSGSIIPVREKEELSMAHFSLLSRNNPLTSEAQPASENFKIGDVVYTLDNRFNIGDISLLGNPITLQQNGQNIIFTIRGPTDKSKLAGYLPNLLQEALSRSQSLHDGTLSENITIILADKYDYLAGDHKKNNTIVLNTPDLEGMRMENPAFASEFIVSLLSEELAHERGAGGETDTEKILAQGCALDTKFSLHNDMQQIQQYVSFIKTYAEDMEGYRGYLSHLEEDKEDVYVPNKYDIKMRNQEMRDRYKDVYMWFLSELNIDQDDIRLRNNIATASYYIARVKDGHNDAKKTLEVFKNNFYPDQDIKQLDIKYKKQLIIAIYAVSMNKRDAPLQDTINIYKKEFDLDIASLDNELKKQLITATYEVNMKKGETSLQNAISIYRKEFNLDIASLDNNLKKQLIIATYKVGMSKGDESLQSAIYIYRKELKLDIANLDIDYKKQLIIATYNVGMSKRDESLQNTIDIYGKEFSLDMANLDNDLKKQLITATYAVSMNKGDESLQSAINIYKKEFGLDMPNLDNELKKQLIIAAYVIAMNKGDALLQNAIDIYKKEFNLDIANLDNELKKQLIIATYEVSRNKGDASLQNAIDIYKKEFDLDIANLDNELKKQLIIATYNVSMNKGDASLQNAIDIYKKEFNLDMPNLDNDLKKQLIIATYAVGMNKGDESLQNTIDIYKKEFGLDIPNLDNELKKQLIIATYVIAMNKGDASLQRITGLLPMAALTLYSLIQLSWRIALLNMKDGQIKSLLDKGDFESMKEQLDAEIFNNREGVVATHSFIQSKFNEEVVSEERFDKDVEKKLNALRERWRLEPEAFTAIRTQHGVDRILERMQSDPGCFIGVGDMSKIAVINYVFTRKIVDKLIPIMIRAADFVLSEYDGFAVRVGGDELCMILPSDLSMEEVNRIRLEIQQTLAYFIDGKYSFTKIENMSDESMNSLNNTLKSETNDPLVGIYKDKDGYFIIYDRSNLTSSLAGLLRPGSLILSLPSPRIRFGIVRSEKEDKDVHADYGRSKEHAEYVLRVARENGLNGATSEVLAGLDKFKAVKSVIPRLSGKDRTGIVKKYTKLGIQLFADDIEQYYPAVIKERLYYVLRKMSSAGVGTTILIRGPPDGFYVINREDSKRVSFMKLDFVYQPYGDFKKEIDEAIETGRFTARDLRWRQGGYGFKLLNEFCDYSTANKVILGINNLLNQTFEKEQALNGALADTIGEGVNRELRKENVQTVVKVILSDMPIYIDGEQGIYEKAIEDIDYFSKFVIPNVPDKMLKMVTAKGNIFKMLYRDNEKFKSLTTALRRKERRYFQGILNEAYGNPALNSSDMASLHTARSDEVSAKAQELSSVAISADEILYLLSIQLEKWDVAFSFDELSRWFDRLETSLALSKQEDIESFRLTMDRLDPKTKARIAYNIERFKNERKIYSPTLRKIFEIPKFYENETLAELSIISYMATHVSIEEIAVTDFGAFELIEKPLKKGKDYIFKFRKENAEYTVRLTGDLSLVLEEIREIKDDIDGEVQEKHMLSEPLLHGRNFNDPESELLRRSNPEFVEAIIEKIKDSIEELKGFSKISYPDQVQKVIAEIKNEVAGYSIEDLRNEAIRLLSSPHDGNYVTQSRESVFDVLSNSCNILEPDNIKRFLNENGDIKERDISRLKTAIRIWEVISRLSQLDPMEDVGKGAIYKWLTRASNVNILSFQEALRTGL